MKRRLLIALVALALALAACAEPGVVSGDDVNQESESVTEDPASDHTSASEGTTDGDSATDPGAVSDETLTNDATTLQEPGTDAGDPTTSTTNNESLLVTNPPKATPSTTTTTRPTEDNPGVDPSLLPFVDQAKADLAGRLGVDAGAIGLISAELVEWSDASLGCPQPGMVYAQVPTDGSLIVLSHGGAEYRYHTGGSVYVPFLCE